jgi:hypothetical protein
MVAKGGSMLKDTFWIAPDGEVLSMQRIFNDELKPTVPLMITHNVVEVVWPDGTWERFEIGSGQRNAGKCDQH